jgi:hypothetical protein
VCGKKESETVLIRFATVSVVALAGAMATSATSVGCSGSSASPSLGGGSSGGSSGSSGSGDDASGSSGGTSGASSSSTSGGTSSSGGSTSGGSSSSGTSSSGSGTSSGGSSTSSSSGGGSIDAGPYPAGPYCQPAGSGGNLPAGCVLPNATWIGYSDPTGTVQASTAPYANYTLEDARNTGKRYAMINVAEFDCPGCQNSATELQARGGQVEQAGGLVIEVLETEGFTMQATMTDLNYWATHYMMENNVVKDPDGSGTPTLNFYGRRDQAYIVDLKTMTILQYIDGSIISSYPAENSAGLAMDALLKLLGDD